MDDVALKKYYVAWFVVPPEYVEGSAARFDLRKLRQARIHKRIKVGLLFVCLWADEHFAIREPLIQCCRAGRVGRWIQPDRRSVGHVPQV